MVDAPVRGSKSASSAERLKRSMAGDVMEGGSWCAILHSEAVRSMTAAPVDDRVAGNYRSIGDARPTEDPVLRGRFLREARTARATDAPQHRAHQLGPGIRLCAAQAQAPLDLVDGQ